MLGQVHGTRQGTGITGTGTGKACGPVERQLGAEAGPLAGCWLEELGMGRQQSALMDCTLSKLLLYLMIVQISRSTCMWGVNGSTWFWMCSKCLVRS